MRKNFGAKPWTYPQPVFILATYDENGIPDAMNAAWGGISDDKELTMCISASHKTTANILARKAFTVSMATAEQVVACDYVGIESGKRVPDKLEKTGWHLTRSEFVDAPLVEELPMAVECRLVSYDPESCRLVGEIVNVSADESILDADGKIDPDKLQPITFDPIHNVYRTLGQAVGHAFQDGAKLNNSMNRFSGVPLARKSALSSSLDQRQIRKFDRKENTVDRLFVICTRFSGHR